jgi:hypothetical protein
VDGDHCNALFGFSPNTANGEIFYNNLINNGNACSGGVVLWFNGNGSTLPSSENYGFNNVIWGVSSNPVNIGNHGAGNYGTYYWFNNTVDCTLSGCGGTPPSGPTWTMYENNNQVIGTALDFCSSGESCPVCNKGTGIGCTDLTQTAAAAIAQGYASTEIYPYSPLATCTSGLCGTVQHATNVLSYCTALSAINAAAGTACRASTSVSCAYITSNHTLNCPNDPANARPSTGAWDIGAYLEQEGPLPAPPGNLLAIVQ